jgi:hypothetical protein
MACLTLPHPACMAEKPRADITAILEDQQDRKNAPRTAIGAEGIREPRTLGQSWERKPA